MADLLARPLVIGSSGQLGSELVEALSGTGVVALDHAQIEIEDDASVQSALARFQPTVVINTAAFHNVDECERKPERAFAVNAIAVDRLAAACARAGAAFATISSDYVFDGTKGTPYGERDEARPLNVYGVSKRAGELCAQRHGSRWFVFRTSGLFGSHAPSRKGHTFVDRLFGQIRNGETPRIVTDVVFSPSYAPDIADAIRRVLEREAFGLSHVTNGGSCSWFDYATEALKLANLPVRIAPTSYREFTSAVERPRCTPLAHEALASLGITMPPWQDGLRRYVNTRLALSS